PGRTARAAVPRAGQLLGVFERHQRGRVGRLIAPVGGVDHPAACRLLDRKQFAFHGCPLGKPVAWERHASPVPRAGPRWGGYWPGFMTGRGARVPENVASAQSAHEKATARVASASDGGRYKVRTCDPCRVKAMLYR